MQSVSPHIIKHFIPLSFSHLILDHPLPRKPISRPTQTNPLQNIKLKQIQTGQGKDCVLTFTNKSSGQFAAKKQVKFRKLMEQLQEEHVKMALIKEEIRRHLGQVEQPEEMQVVNRRHTKTDANRLPSRKQTRNRQAKTAAQGTYRHRNSQLNLQCLQSPRLKSSPNTARSTRKTTKHFRLSSSPFASGLGSPIRMSEVGDTWTSNAFLRVKGCKAPQKEIMDHLKRNSSEGGHFVYRTHK